MARELDMDVNLLVVAVIVLCITVIAAIATR